MRVERMYYENVFRSLQKNNIRYAVAGGVALVPEKRERWKKIAGR